MDATKRPLLIPPEFGTYAEKHGLFETYQRMLQQLLIHRPEDPLTFFKEHLQKENDDLPHVMILGPPAAGKHTMARLLSSKLRAAHITPQTLITETESDIRLEAQKIMREKGDLPTEMWLQLVEHRLELFDAVKKGWVMEGFPRTREQAQALQARGITPKHVVFLEAPDTVLVERAAGKRIDPKTGDVYHTTFDWPSAPDVEARLEAAPGTSEDEVVARLVEYHRHKGGLDAAFRTCNKAINADQPKTDVFSQLMTFVCSKPRSAAPHTPRIVLLGPTGSGKGVQAALLASKYNIVNVSCGQLIKQAIADESKAGGACKPYVEKDMMVPDSLVLNVLRERLSQLDCVTRGWVLHGYPDTREQAEQLTYAGFVPNRVFFLDVPNDSVLERLNMRATDPVTGERYHLLYNPPHTQEVKERLSVHPKDQQEEVHKRLSNYSAYMEELQDFYEDAQHINADQDPHTVFECIESMVVNLLPRRL